VRFWHTWIARSYLTAYRETAAAGAFLPKDPVEFAVLLDFYLIKRAANELRYELLMRPATAGIPVKGLLQMVEAPAVAPR